MNVVVVCGRATCLEVIFIVLMLRVKHYREREGWYKDREVYEEEG